MPNQEATASERIVVEVRGARIEVFAGRGLQRAVPMIAAAHPADAFGEAALKLLQDAAHARAVCVNPRGLGGSSPRRAIVPQVLEEMVDEIEAARRALGYGPWLFWGMSGGGWLGQLYALRHPSALAGLILESICPCFRVRLADPNCVLSPFHPAWHDKLAAAGLIDPRSHERDASQQADATEWLEVEGVGTVFRRSRGPALLVSPIKLAPEMLRVMPALYAVDTRALLSRITVPTLVLCGTADPIVPIAHARALHEAIADSTFVAIEGAGHVPVSQGHPEVARAVQRFIAERVPVSPRL